MRHVPGGALLVAEGIGGSGKSTLCAALARSIRELGWDAISTREPGGTELGVHLRSLLLADARVNPWSEAFLFEADRAQTFGEIIQPALTSGSVVISDRGPFGTIAYQGFGRGLDLSLIDSMSSTAWQGRRADLVLLVDIEPRIAMARKNGQGEADRFDDEAYEFQQLVRDGYLAAASRHGEGVLVLDGLLSPEALLQTALGETVKVLEVLKSRTT